MELLFAIWGVIAEKMSLSKCMFFFWTWDSFSSSINNDGLMLSNLPKLQKNWDSYDQTRLPVNNFSGEIFCWMEDEWDGDGWIQLLEAIATYENPKKKKTDPQPQFPSRSKKSHWKMCSSIYTPKLIVPESLPGFLSLVTKIADPQTLVWARCVGFWVLGKCTSDRFVGWAG